MQASQTPSIQERLARLDGVLLGGTPSDFAALIAAETQKWRKVIKVTKIRAG